MTSRAFRNAMALFPSGVTVITADDGEAALGMTVASFTSVSLEPPLVLACIGEGASIRPIVERAGAFAAHVLGANQRETAELFAYGEPAARAAALFRQSDAPPPLRPPRLLGALARFECDLEQVHPAGDHLILVGRVRAVEAAERADAPAPLTWWLGALGSLTPR